MALNSRFSDWASSHWLLDAIVTKYNQVHGTDSVNKKEILSGNKLQNNSNARAIGVYLAHELQKRIWEQIVEDFPFSSPLAVQVPYKKVKALIAKNDRATIEIISGVVRAFNDTFPERAVDIAELLSSASTIHKPYSDRIRKAAIEAAGAPTRTVAKGCRVGALSKPNIAN